jgi:hypothetical protein
MTIMLVLWMGDGGEQVILIIYAWCSATTSFYFLRYSLLSLSLDPIYGNML